MESQDISVQEAGERSRRQTSSCSGSKAAATVNQVHTTPLDEESFWIFAVGVWSGRNAQILVTFARRTSHQPLLGGRSVLHDAQGHLVEVHVTRTVCMRLGPGGRSVGAEFMVTHVKSPTLVKQGFKFEAGPAGCKMSRGNRSVTLDVVTNPLWVDAEAYTTAEGALNADARFVAPVVRRATRRTIFESRFRLHEAFRQPRAPRESSAQYLDSSSPLEDMRKRLRELRAPVWGNKKKTNEASSAGEKRLSVDTWKIKRCWTDDDATWRTQSTQTYQGP